MTCATVLIVEPYATGHRGVWLRWISEQLVQHKWHVVVVTLAESLRRPAFEWLARPCPSIDVVSVDRPGKYESGGNLWTLLAAELRTYRLLTHLCKEAQRVHSINAVLLPFGDYAPHITALLGSPFGTLPWIPIVMRPNFHHRNMGINAPKQPLQTLRAALFRSFLRCKSLSTCFTIDHTLQKFLSAYPEARSKISYLPDPVEPVAQADKTESRARLGIPPDAVVVLVYGTLTSKKGVKYLLPAVRRVQPTYLHVLCVGTTDSEFRNLLNSPDAAALLQTNRLHLIDQWATGSMEASAFAAADVVWLGYSGHWQSSGVLVQAGRAALPIIACDTGLIGWTVTNYQCGLIVPVDRCEAVATALDALLKSPALRESLGRNGLQAFATHTIENASAIISDALRNALTRIPLQSNTGSGDVVAVPAADDSARLNR